MMLITTAQFYARIIAGLHSHDAEVREYANGCMSYLVCFLRLRELALPPHVQAMLKHLPEV